jgi:hypothetical protein
MQASKERVRACPAVLVAVHDVHFWLFALVLAVEELGQCSHFNLINVVVVKPGRGSWYNDMQLLLFHNLELHKSTTVSTAIIGPQSILTFCQH